MPVMVAAVDRQSGQQAHQNPVEAVFLRRTRAARRANHRHGADMPDQHEIAGIDRHAEMIDDAAGRFDRGGNDIAPVGDGRRTEHQHKLRTRLEQVGDGSGDSLVIVRHAPLGQNAGAGRRQAACRHLQRLLHHLASQGPAARSKQYRSCAA